MAQSDESLVSQAARLKDTEAFAELVRRYEQKILLLQRRLTGERALAEDLAQETFLRAWQKLHTFSGSGSFGGWLASLSYNVFRAHWRKTKRQQDEVPLADAEFAAPERDETGPADLDRLLGKLAREDQAIMTLSYAYGLSSTEVGQILEMPAGTIKARIHRAKAKIREEISAPVQDDPAGSDESDAADSSTRTRNAVSKHVNRQDKNTGRGVKSETIENSSRIPFLTASTPSTTGNLTC